MKQVVFAIALLAMASLTGCLTDDLSDDETTDTTSDNTGNTNQDGTINPVGSGGGYSPPETANMTVYELGGQYATTDWIFKDSNRIKSSCIHYHVEFEIYDSDDRMIYYSNYNSDIYGTYSCIDENDQNGKRLDVALGPEPVKVKATPYWIAVF